jgi:hypothetical protein
VTEFSIPLVSALQWWKERAEQEKEQATPVYSIQSFVVAKKFEWK